MRHYQTSDATATGDTTKTSIGQIQVPASARKIVGIWAYAMGAATMTSGEAITGIIELESADVALQPFQLPLDCASVLTSGAIAFQPRVWPVNIDIPGAAKVTGYVTMDVAQTGALKARWGLITE